MAEVAAAARALGLAISVTFAAAAFTAAPAHAFDISADAMLREYYRERAAGKASYASVALASAATTLMAAGGFDEARGTRSLASCFVEIGRSSMRDRWRGLKSEEVAANVIEDVIRTTPSTRSENFATVFSLGIETLCLFHRLDQGLKPQTPPAPPARGDR